MTEIPVSQDCWEAQKGRVVEQGLGLQDLEHLIELGLTKVTEAPTERTAMGAANKRKETIDL